MKWVSILCTVLVLSFKYRPSTQEPELLHNMIFAMKCNKMWLLKTFLKSAQGKLEPYVHFILEIMDFANTIMCLKKSNNQIIVITSMN